MLKEIEKSVHAGPVLVARGEHSEEQLLDISALESYDNLILLAVQLLCVLSPV